MFIHQVHLQPGDPVFISQDPWLSVPASQQVWREMIISVHNKF